MFNKKLFVTDMSKTLGIAAKRIMVVSALPQDDAVGVTNIRCATAASHTRAMHHSIAIRRQH